MKIDVMSVTPELAAEWLKGNTRNRKLSPSLVNDYARDMKSGSWVLNGEAVKRDANGLLLDGQHRLEAVVASGATVQMLVIQGLSEDLQATMDTGRKRTVGDQLALDGESYAHNLAAVARRGWQWDNQNRRFASYPSPTPTEVRAYIEQYPTLRRSAEIGHRVALSFRPVKASVVATAHHLFLRVDPDLTAEMMAQLETGANLGKGHPVLALRERLTNDKLMQRTLSFHQGVAGMVLTWNALRKGEDKQIIKVPTDGRMPSIV